MSSWFHWEQPAASATGTSSCGCHRAFLREKRRKEDGERRGVRLSRVDVWAGKGREAAARDVNATTPNECGVSLQSRQEATRRRIPSTDD